MVGNEHTIFCSGRGGTRDGLLVSSTKPLASLSVLRLVIDTQRVGHTYHLFRFELLHMLLIIDTVA